MKNKPETEADVQAKLEKAKQERAARCFKKISEALESDNCAANVYFKIGDQRVSVASLINLPVEIAVEAK